MFSRNGHTIGSQSVFGTFLNVGLGEFREDSGFLVTDPVHLADRYQHLFASEPVADFYDQLINGPALVIHHKITDMADNAIGGLKVVSAYGLGAAQIRIGGFRLPSRRCGLIRLGFWKRIQDRKAPHTAP